MPKRWVLSLWSLVEDWPRGSTPWTQDDVRQLSMTRRGLAKSTLAGIVTSGGLKAIDAGSLRRARELEAIGFLQITLAANEKISWTGGFGVAS